MVSRFSVHQQNINQKLKLQLSDPAQYEVIGRKGEGTFSEVLKVRNIINGKTYALKQMRKKFKRPEDLFNITEIKAMKALGYHPHIVYLIDIVYDPHVGRLGLLCELMDMNLYELLKGRRNFLQERKVRRYMYQLCKSVDHMHRQGFFHRDIKPENILIKLSGDLIKLADFGSSKCCHDKPPHTEYISTRWYRSPECILTDGFYSSKMDLWSIGCVIFETISLCPLFPGSNELDQIAKIHEVMGTPEDGILRKFKTRTKRRCDYNFPKVPGMGIQILIPQAKDDCVDCIAKLCIYDPDIRPSASQILRHKYFKIERDNERRTTHLDDIRLQRSNISNTVKRDSSAARTCLGSNVIDIGAYQQHTQKPPELAKPAKQESLIRRRSSNESARLVYNRRITGAHGLPDVKRASVKSSIMGQHISNRYNSAATSDSKNILPSLDTSLTGPQISSVTENESELPGITMERIAPNHNNNNMHAKGKAKDSYHLPPIRSNHVDEAKK